MSKRTFHFIAPLAASLVLAATALAAGASVSLNLQGGYANQNRAACGSTNHYVYFHPRQRINFKGQVSPATGSQVKVKLKKCTRGRFVTVKQLHVRVNSRGTYQGSFRIRARGYYFARTYLYGTQPVSKSTKEHFRIR